MLGKKKLFLFDIDGTVCLGDKLIPGVKPFLQDIKQSGGQFIFVTNNATKSVADYVTFFKGLGVACDEANFITASYVTVYYLKTHYPDQLIYVLGTDSLQEELKCNGIRVTTDCHEEGIACVLVSYDNQLTYDKLVDVCWLLTKADVDYVATNPDMVCPVEFGYVPDCGGICEMIAHAVKKEPYYIGKPETAMVDFALKQNPNTKEEPMLVGDRLYTDIRCGKKAGVDTVLVLTGETTNADVSASVEKPNYVENSVATLYKKWRKDRQYLHHNEESEVG